MPKSNPTLSPSIHNIHPSNHSPSRMSDVALRKKKNADAQAAFRARRANYIATLEETVTSLESVVLQLQDSCREARNESQELRQENSRLRHEFREREKFWRALWQTRKAGQDVDSDDLPPLPPLVSSTHGLMGPLHLNQYPTQTLPYRMNDEPSICTSSSFNHGPNQYQNQPTSAPFSTETELPADSSSHSLNHRGQRYSPYPYPLHTVHRETPWPSTITQSTSSTGDSGAATGNHSSRSPSFVGSPILTSTEMPFANRFAVEDQKTSLSNLDSAPYVFSNSRSLSPMSTPSSSSSTSLASFPFPFPDPAGHDRTDLDYRRHSHPQGAEVTLHGGTADISLIGPATDAVRYRLGTRHLGPDRPLLPSLPISGSDNGSQNEQGSSDGDSTPYLHPRLHTRRPARSRSRSLSPGAPTISGTLAVIKAQAFGALRRTRARTKKTSEGAAKVAMDVLEARGIGMSNPTSLKRQRLDDDHDVSKS